MNRERIKFTDTGMDIVIKMANGNPGAMTCLMDMLKYTSEGSQMPGLFLILNLDTLGLYGEKIYMLWNDCCDRDMAQMELVLRNWHMGHLAAYEIMENLSNGRGKPFPNLKSLEEMGLAK